MKVRFLAAAALCLILSAAVPLTVRAEVNPDEVDEPYVYKVSYVGYGSDGSYTVNEYTYTSNVPICFVQTKKGECYGPGGNKFNAYHIQMYYYLPSGSDTVRGVHRTGRVEYRKADGSLKNELEVTDYEYAHPLPYYLGVGQGSCYYRFETDAPIFSSHDAALHYLTTGDASGAVNNPKFDSMHDFKSDVYNKDIPVPELKSITHHGFTVVNNSDGKYYTDIFQTTRFYGVRVQNTGFMSYYPTVDEDWLFTFHIYNYVDSGQPTNQENVYIPELYGIDPEEGLINDFKEWTVRYPSYSSLPSYSWYMSGTGASTSYDMSHKFSSSSSKTDLEQLQDSQQAESTYIVRFRDQDGNYGQWVKYVFRDGVKVGGGFIRVETPRYDDSGKVEVGEDGDMIGDVIITGRQDYETGVPEYGDTTTYDKWWEVVGDKENWSFLKGLGAVGDVFNFIGKTFDGLSNSIGSFSSLVSACFGFLPGQLVTFLVSGMVVVVFIGIIKAVIK